MPLYIENYRDAVWIARRYNGARELTKGERALILDLAYRELQEAKARRTDPNKPQVADHNIAWWQMVIEKPDVLNDLRVMTPIDLVP